MLGCRVWQIVGSRIRAELPTHATQEDELLKHRAWNAGRRHQEDVLALDGHTSGD